MQATLDRPTHPAAAAPQLEGTRATLSALGSALLTLIGIHRH
jgi:hypothetical protein